MTRPTIADLAARCSRSTLARNPQGLGAAPRQDAPVDDRGTTGVRGDTPVDAPGKCLPSPYGRCPHTSRKYRSKTEARWAAEHPSHRFEAVGITTAAGRYWPDFVGPPWTLCHGQQLRCGNMLIEVKGAYIRDRALHKVKAAIRPARALGFAGIWLAVWNGGRWTVTELEEG